MDPGELYHRILVAYEFDASNRERKQRQDEFKSRFNLLTQRERQVLCYLFSGDSTKRIAYRLKLSSRTVEVHRQHIMQKMEYGSLVKLSVDLIPVNSSKRCPNISWSLVFTSMTLPLT
ncbi:MAG: hypothetical protein IID30_11030 [Planctomycetes bacterium]|nr:hypothetical protein [Planctomycetota bacterium]